jgi:dimethylamine monooxygenase subunit A
MSLDFKPTFDGFFRDETFVGDFTFRNSPASIRRFPFPFDRDEYMYSVNIEPHVPVVGRPNSVFQHAFDVDEHYVSEMRDRARVLAQDPLRCQSLPHMELAGWDLLELIMESKARDYPQWFSLSKSGDQWHWINRPLGIEQRFTFLDASTLPYGPLEYITRQTQGDFTLQDERDQNLWVDAGMVTTQADWSLDFDIGMNFFEWHAPVPLAHEKGIFDRALKFLLKLQNGAPVRRFNWTMTVNPLLDTAPETYPEWGTMRTTVTPENVGEKLHLRVELQALFRLPRSNAIAFSIRAYLGRFDELVTVPKWGRRLHRVVRDLHPDLAAYKGFLRNRDAMAQWLSQYDDGAPTSPGIWPED